MKHYSKIMFKVSQKNIVKSKGRLIKRIQKTGFQAVRISKVNA